MFNLLPAAIVMCVAFLVAFGLTAYRVAWSAPLLARLGVLPQSWRRWIFDTSRAKKTD